MERERPLPMADISRVDGGGWSVYDNQSLGKVRRGVCSAASLRSLISSDATEKMICAPDEFLLILQKWFTDSASVSFSLWLSGEELVPTALSITLLGRVVAVDPIAQSCMLSSDGGGVIALHLSHWATISYLDKGSLPRAESINEGFLLEKAGASISLLTQEPE
jgi:hypothetical protein